MVALAGLVASILATRLGLFQVFERWVARGHVRHVDELVLVAAVLVLASSVFAFRRWREVRRDLAARLRAEERLRESEERFRCLSDATTEAVAIHDSGRILEVNAAFGVMFGVNPSEAVGMSGLDLVHPDSLEVVQEHMGTGSEEPYEATLLHRDGAPFPAHLVGRSIPYRGRTVRVVAVRDLTERKLAEEALRESEERYRALVEQIPAVTYTWDSTHGLGEAPVPYISPQIETTLGFPREDWLRDPEIWIRQTHPDDREDLAAEWARTDQTGEPFRMEYRMLAQDGRVVWIRDEAVVVARDDAGRPTLWQGVMFDVTEQKRIERERRDLLTRLVGAQEEERRRIAGDIHDDSVQKMTAVGLRLQTLRERETSEEQIDAIDRLERSVSLAIGRLRHLLFELRPPAIDLDGLAAALRDYLDDVRDEAGIEVQLDDRLATEPPPEIRMTAYRIAQEALTNARKHAQASRVDVLLRSVDGGILVRIRDDGLGFDADSLSGPAPGHLGFTAMRERAQCAGGRLRIDSTPGMGSTVEFWLPVVEAQSHGARTDASAR